MCRPTGRDPHQNHQPLLDTCHSPHMSEGLYHHPYPPKTCHRQPEWLQTYRSDICNHEALGAISFPAHQRLSPSLDPHQFAYRANRSTEDAITLTFHTELNRLENKKSYKRILFVDYSSAFNTIIQDILITKLLELQIPLPTCKWIRNFLSSHPQSVRLCPHHSTALTLSTGSPQGLHSEPSTVRPVHLQLLSNSSNQPHY